MNERWDLKEAQTHFPDLVRQAKDSGPQIVTVDEDDAVVIVSLEAYRQLTEPEENIVDFFLNSPLAGLEIEFERDKDIGRDIEL